MPMFEELVLQVDGSASQVIPEVDLTALELKEREHLQEWVLRHPSVLGDGVRIITSEYDSWQSAAGEPVRDRLDVLGLAPDGRLVVAELKRGRAPHSIHMQAINYAAMTSRLRPRDVAELYAQYLNGRGEEVDVDAALAEFESAFLLNEESIRNPRIVLIATEFPASVSASVVWLSERAVDVALIRYKAYRLPTDAVVVTFSRFFPVPTIEDFTIGRYRSPETMTEPVPIIPWDQDALTRLAERANPATLCLLDLCAASDEPVSVAAMQSDSNLTTGQVRGQLAGFTMLLRNKKNGFAQSEWPVEITWLPGGVASYTMAPELKRMWNSIRNVAQTLDPAPLATATNGVQTGSGVSSD